MSLNWSGSERGQLEPSCRRDPGRPTQVPEALGLFLGFSAPSLDFGSGGIEAALDRPRHEFGGAVENREFDLAGLEFEHELIFPVRHPGSVVCSQGADPGGIG